MTICRQINPILANLFKINLYELLVHQEHKFVKGGVKARKLTDLLFWEPKKHIFEFTYKKAKSQYVGVVLEERKPYQHFCFAFKCMVVTYFSIYILYSQ